MSTHILGFPRIGAHRELKKALESFWKGELSREAFLQVGKTIRLDNWRLQQDAGLDFITVGDFSFYDQVLDSSLMVNTIPARFHADKNTDALDLYFRMARGRGLTSDENTSQHDNYCSADTFACEMTKWFDTNYHYIVPEFSSGQTFRYANTKLVDEIKEALDVGIPNKKIKPVLLGPISYLWLGKEKSAGLNRLELLDSLLPVYAEILQSLQALGIEWVQIDEPVLVMDLSPAWKQAFEQAYHRLSFHSLKILLATYFGGVEDNLSNIVNLPVAGFHIDAVRAPEQVLSVADRLPNYKILSLGIVDGRNIWRNDFQQSLAILEPIKNRLKENLWISASCSLLHTPVDLDNERALDAELRAWFAFGKQKLNEIVILNKALLEGRQAVEAELHINESVQQSRRASGRIHNAKLKQRMQDIDQTFTQRQSSYADRALIQHKKLALPLFPTTTIGSFPQTPEIRTARRNMKAGNLSLANYTQLMQAEINKAITEQEELGLDVFVHGEAERNDMVEYFGELLDGFAFTQNGWVQSYGSRCVKPPIIFADVSRPSAMTVEWAVYAQSLTEKPVKGMLTGPVTILQWSFVRDDQARSLTCQQIAFALREEVLDLEKAGIAVIQIDEPALREGLPLRKQHWQAYLDWAVASFRLSASGVSDSTQIHTHMCYSEFNDIMQAIAEMDADVITIETSRSDMELLNAFTGFNYPNEIGPGVYDIHSPRVATKEEMIMLIQKAALHIPAERLWVNPDCGLKTRNWPEVREALKNMVAAAQELRQKNANTATIRKEKLTAA